MLVQCAKPLRDVGGRQRRWWFLGRRGYSKPPLTLPWRMFFSSSSPPLPLLCCLPTAQKDRLSSIKKLYGRFRS